VFDQTITTQKEDWATWDGTNGQGLLMPIGTYFAVLFKDGKALRKIALKWIAH